MEDFIREFKGVWIDREIWLDKRLNALDKVILTEITSLDTKENGCYAGNEYLADFCQCSERKVSASIAKLIGYNYIYQESFNGRQRVLRSRLANFARQNSNFCVADKQILLSHNNNIDNNTSNNKIDNTMSYDVLNYLNEKAGTRYKPIESNLKFIRARLKDYSVDDLKKVIDNKVSEWKSTSMQKYLRCETLFNATKFESYVNDVSRETNKQGDRYYGEIDTSIYDE